MRHSSMIGAAVLALALASAPALAQESARTGDDAALAAFAQREPATPVVVDGVTLAGPVTVLPKPPVDIPPSLHEQIRHLMARLDNAYPEASDARKLHFIADYLGIDFRRLWNAYHPDRPGRPDVTARPVDARPVDRRIDRVDPQRVRPTTVRPAAARPAGRVAVRPSPVTRPSRPRG